VAVTAPDARERLLDAALRVIGEHGVAGLTNRRVAAAAGVSLGSLTYHFASQTDLLREALLRAVAAETARIETLADALRERVRTVGDAAAAAQDVLAAMAMGEAEIAVHELYLQSARDPALHAATRRCFAAYDRVAADILGALGMAGIEGESTGLARSVVAFLAGWQLRRLACGETGPAGSAGVAAGLLTILGGGASAG
jgi:AcrR family transcriptional regulator